jgi:hypothetical protein
MVPVQNSLAVKPIAFLIQKLILVKGALKIVRLAKGEILINVNLVNHIIVMITFCILAHRSVT